MYEFKGLGAFLFVDFNAFPRRLPRRNPSRMYLCFQWWKHNGAWDKQTNKTSTRLKYKRQIQTHLVQHKRFVLNAALLLLHVESINPFSFTFSTLGPSARLPSRWQGVQRTGVKLLELWRSVSGASPIKVISNSWILPFDGRVIPFGSHSPRTRRVRTTQTGSERDAWRSPLMQHFFLDWCTTTTYLARHSQLHALL